MENFEHILLFKTNFKIRDKKLLGALLDNRTGVDEWNIDMDDTDRVLRIISATLNHQYIIQLITHQGYKCSELT